MSRAPAGKERDLFSRSVPAIDLLSDLISLLRFLPQAKNITSPKKQLLLSCSLALRALYSHVKP